MRFVYLLSMLFLLGGCSGSLKTPTTTESGPSAGAEEGYPVSQMQALSAQTERAAASQIEANGKILRTFPDGSHYEGEARNGVPHGTGALVWPDGARYTGAFQDGQRSGYGVFSWPSGNRFEGEFSNGKRHGQGTFIWANGAHYTGTYQMGKKHGTGVFQHANKTVDVCYKVPEQQVQHWDQGLLTADNAPLPDEPPPDLDHEARTNPVDKTFRPRMSSRLSKVPLAPVALKSGVPPIPATAKENDAPPSLPQPRVWHHSHSGMAFAAVPAGCFQMGSNRYAANEKPQHKVCLDAFWIGVHELTQGVWQQYMGTLPEQSKQGEKLPVENVSWNDAQLFVNKLNRASPTHFRLPTEAEWEYACRSAGRDEQFCGGHNASDLAWHKENSDNHPHAVGERQANGLGLYDMSGNMWEWVNDWYEPNYYRRSPSINPKGPLSGKSKVFRGGAWLSAPRFLRSTLRYDLAPDRGYHLLGIRLVAIPPSAVNAIGVTDE